MNKTRQKLIASAFLAVIAISLMVTVSYAWYTLAGSPSLAGVQINIGGDNTIMIAPDIVKVVDGEEVHYPGAFKKSLKISDYDTYDYLETVSGLMPVSTADGIHWFYPPSTDTAIEEQNLSLQDYELDQTLEYANVLQDSTEDSNGCYVYLDFWVVAPMDNCSLRVSIGSADAGTPQEGSYVISLPEPEKATGDANATYSLSDETGEAQACARVGFLINTEMPSNQAMIQYTSSSGYRDQYRSLAGNYQTVGDELTKEEKENYRFTIYEPNGDMHPGIGLSYISTNTGLEYTYCKDGEYAITSPIGYTESGNILANISDRLTVQRTNLWKEATNGETYLNQLFTTAVINKDLREDELKDYFYRDTLQNQFSDYVQKATFFESTHELYFAGGGSVISEEEMGLLQTANATDDAVIVTLKRDVPQRIRMFVWLEGQDVDCVREVSSETFAVGIELAGSTQ